jgi:hypothetical protein
MKLNDLYQQIEESGIDKELFFKSYKQSTTLNKLYEQIEESGVDKHLFLKAYEQKLLNTSSNARFTKILEKINELNRLLTLESETLTIEPEEAVIKHAVEFFKQVSVPLTASVPLTSSTILGKRRMGMPLKEAYDKWVEKLKMSVALGGLNKSDRYRVPYSVFIRAKPSYVERETVDAIQKQKAFDNIRRLVCNLIEYYDLDSKQLTKGLIKKYSIPMKSLSNVVQSLNTYFNQFKGRGSKDQHHKQAVDTIMTALMWDDDAIYKYIRKELNLAGGTYGAYDRAKERASALQEYNEKLKILKEQNKIKKQEKKKKKTSASTSSSSSSLSISLPSEPPKYYAIRNRRKDATEVAVIEHAIEFYKQVSVPLTAGASAGRRRMDMGLKEAYDRWIEKLKMSVDLGGLNKSDTFHVSYSVFMRAKPSYILTMEREYLNDSTSSSHAVMPMKDSLSMINDYNLATTNFLQENDANV